MNRVFVRRSDLKSGSEILTGKFLAYMTQIEARSFRKAWIQYLASFSQFGVRKFDVENSTLLDAFQIERADSSWKIRYHDHFAFFATQPSYCTRFLKANPKFYPLYFCSVKIRYFEASWSVLFINSLALRKYTDRSVELPIFWAKSEISGSTCFQHMVNNWKVLLYILRLSTAGKNSRSKF